MPFSTHSYQHAHQQGKADRRRPDWIGGARAGLLPVKPMETAARSPANFRNPVPGFAEDHFRPFAPQLAGQRQIISSKSSPVLYGHLGVTTCRFIPVYSRVSCSCGAIPAPAALGTRLRARLGLPRPTPYVAASSRTRAAIFSWYSLGA